MKPRRRQPAARTAVATRININFIPPVGATQALVRLIGRPAALRYLYDGTLANPTGSVNPPRRVAFDEWL